MTDRIRLDIADIKQGDLIRHELEGGGALEYYALSDGDHGYAYLAKVSDPHNYFRLYRKVWPEIPTKPGAYISATDKIWTFTNVDGWRSLSNPWNAMTVEYMRTQGLLSPLRTPTEVDEARDIAYESGVKAGKTLGRKLGEEHMLNFVVLFLRTIRDDYGNSSTAAVVENAVLNLLAKVPTTTTTKDGLYPTSHERDTDR